MTRYWKGLILIGPLALMVALLSSGPPRAVAQVQGQKGAGWCGNSELQQLSVPIAQATQNADTQIITVGAAQRCAICGMYWTNGSSSTQLNYGTGTNCGTGTGHLTGAMVGTVGPTLSSSAPVLFSNVVGNNICLATGASGAAQGYLSYVCR